MVFLGLRHVIWCISRQPRINLNLKAWRCE